MTMYSQSLLWRGKLVSVTVGRMLIRGVVMPAVHPLFFWREMNIGLRFQIGTLKQELGHPVQMLGFQESYTTSPVVNAELADFFSLAADLDDDGALALTDEFCRFLVKKAGLSETRQGYFETISSLKQEAAEAGMDPFKDPQFVKMANGFWESERSKARGALDLQDVDQTRVLLGF